MNLSILPPVSLGLNHYWAFAYFGSKYYPFLEVLTDLIDSAIHYSLH